MAGIPRHVAIIPDGNRRWARAQGRSPEEGHRAGIGHVGAVAEALWQAGVEVFTFWWGSPANLTRRTPHEVGVIVGSLADWLSRDAPDLVARHQARFAAYGRWGEMCPSIGPGVAAVQAQAGQGPRQLALLMAYDGHEEILAAADALGGSGGDRVAFGGALWTADLPPVDLLVRTGGEPHLSAGFMLWRIGEAQLAFPEEPWPAYDKAALERDLARYAATERRFGA
jgi:undecaprenyl diphosphate synthase